MFTLLSKKHVLLFFIRNVGWSIQVSSYKELSLKDKVDFVLCNFETAKSIINSIATVTF